MSGKRLICLNAFGSYKDEQVALWHDGDDGTDDLGCFDEAADEPAPARIRVGFVRRPACTER